MFVEKLALRTAESSRVGGRRGAAVPVVADSESRDLVGQAVAAGNCPPGTGVVRRDAPAVVQREGRRAARLAESRDERPVVCRPVERHGHRECRGRHGREVRPTDVRPRRGLGEASRPLADSEQPAPEERHHRQRALRSAEPILVEHRHAARHGLDRLASDGGGRVRGGKDPGEGASGRAARGARRKRVGVRRCRHRRRERHAAGRQGSARLRRARRRAARRFAASPAGVRRSAGEHRCQRGVSRRRIGRSGKSRAPRPRRSPLRAVDDRRGEGRQREHRRLRRQHACLRQRPPVRSSARPARTSAIARTRRSPISICSASAPSSASRRWRSIATRAPSTGTSSRTGTARRRSRWTSRPAAPSRTRRSSAGESRSCPSTRRSSRDTMHVKADRDVR